MASLDHRLNPLFSIKECMTCGALYTADFCCSKGGLVDKILVPKPLERHNQEKDENKAKTTKMDWNGKASVGTKPNQKQ
ncbi:hypothetical protein Tco_1318732 [Tanacetum coccineum]